MSRPIALIFNRSSGKADHAAIDRAVEVFGDRVSRHEWNPKDPISGTVDDALAGDPEIVVAAGGDGTVMAVADAMLGRGVPMAVLPLGTFNYFSRGLGQSETPEEAAEQILAGQSHDIRVGEVNGHVFLNNASLGIYPSILRERESVYSRWGRSRLAAHWSVLKTFLRFRKPTRMTITSNGQTETRRSALVFVGRSAYQLERFGIEGESAISDDLFAVLIARAETRRALFGMTLRLVMGRPLRGKDYDLIETEDLTIETQSKRTLLAYDGEKSRTRGLRARNFEYVRAARALGVKRSTIMFRHMLPNAMVATVTMLPFIITGTISTLASLDFLGFGLPSSAPSLGELTLQAKQNLQAPWLAFTAFFTFAIMLSLLVFIFEGIRDAFDPRKTFQ